MYIPFTDAELRSIYNILVRKLAAPDDPIKVEYFVDSIRQNDCQLMVCYPHGEPIGIMFWVKPFGVTHQGFPHPPSAIIQEYIDQANEALNEWKENY